MKDALFRGVMIGGALGVMATYVLNWDPPRAFGIGIVAGLLAGYTKYKIDSRKDKDE
ncbi:hypothetical protein [Desulfovibrio ferrophilus]|uniref:Uncharacterized protein n=1 Tax=Desulfovibrio ferrophilus TaxID=241368 RepID=A0A2Z6B0K9_9BACT|nr:hypothetical protein [Desulfovibrio ferrophilus]BBD09003.1 uncharacterized protein DFE_2277 [Desulfovibrio ferrophilus]